MKLDTHYINSARKQLCLSGRFIAALTLKPIGFSHHDDSVVLHASGQKTLTLTRLPYSMAYYRTCVESGIHLKHWTSRLKVRRDVYEVYVTNGTYDLVIKTTSREVCDSLKIQYKALPHIPDRTIRYGGLSLNLSGGFHGFGIGESKQTFQSIADYNTFKETVQIIKR